MEAAAALAALAAMTLWFGAFLAGYTTETTRNTGPGTYAITISSKMPVLACVLVFDVLVIWAAWRLAKRGGIRAADVLALRVPLGGGKAILAVACVVAAFLAVEFAAAPLYRLAAENATKLINGFVQQAGWPLAIVTIGIAAPLAEELWLRGFLLPALAKTRLGFWGAGILMSTLFAALHAAQYALVLLVPIFFLGLVLTWGLGLTGSLWVPIAIHISNNLLALLLLWMWPPI